MSVLAWVALVWGLWAAAEVTVFLLGAWLVTPAGPSFNGFRVHVPRGHAALLTETELAAVVMHELGHRAHGHVWFNLLRACCAIPMSAGRRTRQELEADDYVSAELQPYLASALRKMSTHPLDILRATRLEAKRLPSERDARSTTLEGRQ